MKVTAVKINPEELAEAFASSPTIQSLFSTMEDCEKMLGKTSRPTEPVKTEPETANKNTPENITIYQVSVELSSGYINDTNVLSKIGYIKVENSDTILYLNDMTDEEFFKFVAEVKTAKLQEKFNIFYRVKTETPDGPDNPFLTDTIRIS